MDKYFRGKKVLGIRNTESAYSHQHMQHVTYQHIELDGDDALFLWCSTKHEPLTTEVPRAYREYTNQQLLEDINS